MINKVYADKRPHGLPGQASIQDDAGIGISVWPAIALRLSPLAMSRNSNAKREHGL